jgi:NADPH:quinone reductase-like Zn-dependent oxidoreductase
MKAAVYKSYGPPEVLQVEEVAKPVIEPEGHEDRVLVKVYSASVNPFDVYHRMGFLPVRASNGWRIPKQQIMGIDVAGTVEAVGKNVTKFKVGDKVFGSCLGSHAEYVRVLENKITKMPDNLTFTQAGSVGCAALSALQAIKDKAQVRKGQKALIIGGSGGIGHFAVQIARHVGAEVTAVCSTSNVAWVKELGAHHVIDYTKEDFTKNGKRYDVILDASAARTYFSCKGSLTASGFYMTENPTKPRFQLLQVLLISVTKDKKFRGPGLTQSNVENLECIREYLELGIIKPVVERTYRLDQIAQAHRHVENGHTKGKVVVEVLKG